MIRLLVMSVALTSAAVAHADDRCTTTAPKPGSHRLALAFTEDPVMGGRVLAAGSGSELPAISEDGTELVQLFVDAQDFTGAPITTLVVWSTASGKRVSQFRLGGDSHAASQVEARRDELAVLARANAKLAKTKWRGVASFQPCASSPESGADTIIVGRAHLVVDRATSQLSDGARAVATFDAPGNSFGPDIPSGGCGEVLGIKDAFGTTKIVVVVPRVQLGGDSCFGSLSADLAIAVRLP
jgi:hypothetical protein